MKNLGCIEFVLLEHERKRPVSLDEFDGKFYVGSVTLLKCSGNASLAGTQIMFKSNRLISCAPYWVWTHPNAALKLETHTLEVWGDHLPLCRPLRRAGALSVDYLMDELEMPPMLQQQARSLLGMVSTAKQLTLSSMPGQPLYELSDLWRLPSYVFVVSYMGHITKLRRLTASKLEALAQTLRTEPWSLIWGAQRPRLRAEGYYRALRDHKLQPGLDIQVAARIFYDAVDTQRSKHKHTLFIRQHYNTTFPCLPLAERRALEDAVYTLLTRHALRWLTPAADCFALTEDARDAESTMASLQRIAENARTLGEPTCRNGVEVPAIFGYDQLTRKQREIFDSAQCHWLTLISGGPGTGKTALGTALCSHWHYVLQVGFVGMLVKMIRRRNGKRREVAHTIDYLLTVAKHNELAPEWLDRFEVLVVEEVSNVNMERFAGVLSLFRNVRKLICVGDHEQLKPLEPGDPMGDLMTAYPQRVFRLTENLRVQRGLEPLQEASPHISAGHPERIGWQATGPISLVRHRGDDASEMLYQLLGAIHKLEGRYALSHCHIIVLQNHKADGRFALNKAAEEAWTRLGVLSPPQRRYVPAHVYPGAKISITQNYNTPIDVGTKGKSGWWQSDPVVNGDLLIVRSVEKAPGGRRGLRVVVVDSEDPAEEPEQRTLWIEAEHGISPKHVVPGYASTCYKVQGGEFRYVIFWLDKEPGDQWTRASAYVATSRAKRWLWVVGEQAAFNAICKRPEPRRRTAFSQLIPQLPDANTPLTHFTPTIPTPSTDQQLASGGPDVPVVPTLASVAEELAAKKKKE
jgi:hypothetical protein